MSDAILSADPSTDAVSPTSPANRDVWIDRFRRFATSGLTITAFCKGTGPANHVGRGAEQTAPAR